MVFGHSLHYFEYGKEFSPPNLFTYVTFNTRVATVLIPVDAFLSPENRGFG